MAGVRDSGFGERFALTHDPCRSLDYVHGRRGACSFAQAHVQIQDRPHPYHVAHRYVAGLDALVRDEKIIRTGG